MCSVTQGSVLHPILFDSYINDTVNMSEKINLCWLQTISSKESEDVENTVNLEMSKI